MVIVSTIEGYACEEAPAHLLVVKGCGSTYVIASKIANYIDMQLADMNMFELGIEIPAIGASKINYDRTNAQRKADTIARAFFPQLRRVGGHIRTSMSRFFGRLACDCNVFNNFGPQYNTIAKMVDRAVELGVRREEIRMKLTEPRVLSTDEFIIDTVDDLISTLQQMRDYAIEFEVFGEKLFEMTKSAGKK